MSIKFGLILERTRTLGLDFCVSSRTSVKTLRVVILKSMWPRVRASSCSATTCKCRLRKGVSIRGVEMKYMYPATRAEGLYGEIGVD